MMPGRVVHSGAGCCTKYGGYDFTSGGTRTVDGQRSRRCRRLPLAAPFPPTPALPPSPPGPPSASGPAAAAACRWLRLFLRPRRCRRHRRARRPPAGAARRPPAPPAPPAPTGPNIPRPPPSPPRPWAPPDGLRHHRPRRPQLARISRAHRRPRRARGRRCWTGARAEVRPTTGSRRLAPWEPGSKALANPAGPVLAQKFARRLGAADLPHGNRGPRRWPTLLAVQAVLHVRENVFRTRPMKNCVVGPGV